MSNPRGEMIPRPIKSSFREGLSVLEYFISTHGARKGLADTALRTADSGYLTRRLVDVAQELIIRIDDCGSTRGIWIEGVAPDGPGHRNYLETRAFGRLLTEDVKLSDGTVYQVGTLLLDDVNIAAMRDDTTVDRIRVRSVLTCESPQGVCAACYGLSLATGFMIELGEAVGVIAAQSIGEPGTQLTMRTFHTGGVVGEDITHGLPRVVELFEARTPKGAAVLAHHSGVVRMEDDEIGRHITVVADDGTEDSTLVAARAHLEVTDGQEVGAGDALVEGPKDPKELLEVKGIRETQQYLVEEVQKVYRDQGVSIHDKHIELIVRQMLRRVLVAEPGDAPFLPGERVDNQIYAEVNRTLVEDGNVPAEGRPELMGITKASLATESWLSAASFQETTRVLTEAAIEGSSDQLFGLKENIIIGKLIPAGSGMEHYRNIRLEMPDAEAMPFWAMGSGESDTEDLANWLRDMGEGVSDDPFDSSIDASWLGAAPTAEDAFGNPIAVSDSRTACGCAPAPAPLRLRSLRKRALRRRGPKLPPVPLAEEDEGEGPMATPRQRWLTRKRAATTAAGRPATGHYRLSDIRALEAQSIHIFREVAAEFERPVLLFSGGKDSIVMLHLAKKAFWPAPVPFPVLHVDTGRNFDEVLEFRDRHAADARRAARCGQGAGRHRRRPDGGGHLAGRHPQPAADADAAAGHRGGPSRRRLRRGPPGRGEGAGQGAHLQLPRRVRPVGPEEPAARAVEPLQRPPQQGRAHPGLPALELDRARRVALHPRRAHRRPVHLLRPPPAGVPARRHAAWRSPSTWPRTRTTPSSRPWCASGRSATPTAPAASSRWPRRSTSSSPRWPAPG